MTDRLCMTKAKRNKLNWKSSYLFLEDGLLWPVDSEAIMVSAEKEEVMDGMKLIKKTQQTIDDLLEAQQLCRVGDSNELRTCSSSIQILYGDDDDHSATIGIKETAKAGDLAIEPHAHPTMQHYLICIEGKWSVRFADNLRILSPGDCVAIPMGQVHETRAIADNSKLAFLCIPKDNGYHRKSGEKKDV